MLSTTSGLVIFQPRRPGMTLQDKSESLQSKVAIRGLAAANNQPSIDP